MSHEMVGNGDKMLKKYYLSGLHSVLKGCCCPSPARHKQYLLI